MKTPEIISEILERSIKGNNGEEKKIKEILNPTKHFWVSDDSGDIIIKYEGILKLREFVGAIFLKPELQSISTPRNIVFLCGVQFPDGEISYEIGEASLNNTHGLGSDYLATMAVKRGWSRAFLRSNNMKLFEVYSEEEGDFRHQKPVETTEFPEYPAQEPTPPELFEQPAPQELKNSFPDKSLLFLPEYDEKYPGVNIYDIFFKMKDFSYLKEICKKYDNPEYRKASELLLKILELHQKRRRNQKKHRNHELQSEPDEPPSSDFLTGNQNRDTEPAPELESSSKSEENKTPEVIPG